MKIEVILAAAGKGERIGAGVPKALLPVGGKPLFLHSLKVFGASALIKGIVLVVPPAAVDKFSRAVAKSAVKKRIKIVRGGKERQDSVRNGLAALDADTDTVFIHDAARPFVTPKIIKDLVKVLRRDQAATVAVPVKPTIKRVDPVSGYVAATLDRRFLWDVQTPQGFRREVLAKAHAQAGEETATDDAYLVEKLGEKVKIVPGDYRNFKVTTSEDIIFAEGLIKRNK